jgi:hypothetical protein
MSQTAQEEALDALRHDTRDRIHSFLGMVGADWDTEDVLQAVAESSDVSWVDNIFHHDLCVRKPDGKYIRFDVHRP